MFITLISLASTNPPQIPIDTYVLARSSELQPAQSWSLTCRAMSTLVPFDGAPTELGSSYGVMLISTVITAA